MSGEVGPGGEVAVYECAGARCGSTGTRSMRLVGEGDSVLVVNDRLRLSGVPADAHRYEVNGRTPLGWFIDRYRISTDKESGITNDPNAWFPDEAAFIAAERRIVYLSVEYVRMVDGLSCAFPESERQSGGELG